MKIALIGYGKMGHAIERHAIARGHQIVARIDCDNSNVWDSPSFLSADVAIEFSTPQTAVDNYLKAFQRNIPVVSGTTGWTDKSDFVTSECQNHDATFLWSSNFSIGVNIFMALNRYLATIMADMPQYHPSLKEIHHIHKLDHPSGTAITLAQQLIDIVPSIKSWTENPDSTPDNILIEHERIGEVPGTHTITWDSDVDSLTIEHRAKNREGFALGAVVAAEWIAGKKGIHSFDEVIHDIISHSAPADVTK